MTFLSALITLCLVIDAFGSIPTMLSLLPQARNNVREYRRIILRESVFALGVLLCFLFAGNHILQAMHVSQASLGIAGGVVLFMIAIRMVFPHAQSGFVAASALTEKPLLVPIAIPLMAGPGAMTMVMLLAAGDPGRLLEWAGVVVVACSLSVLVFMAAPFISRLLGPRVLSAIERLMGMVLVTVSVEMILTGVRSALAQ